MKSSSESWSATMRLISSGIVRSKLRSPASTWPIGMSSFEAVSAAATVEFTSPGHEHHVRLGLQQHRLEPLHHAGRLLRVRARADAERVVGLADAELLEEDLGHLAVVVLAGVDEHVLELVRAPRQLGGDRARSSSCSAACRRPRGSCGDWPRQQDKEPARPTLRAASLLSMKQVVMRDGKTQVVDVPAPGPTSGPRARRERRLGDLQRHRALRRRARLRLAGRARDPQPRSRRARRSSTRASTGCARRSTSSAARRRPTRRSATRAPAPCSTRAGSPTSASASGSPARAPAARTTPRSSRCPATSSRRCPTASPCATPRSRDRGDRAAGRAPRRAGARRARRRRRARSARAAHRADAARRRLPRRRRRAASSAVARSPLSSAPSSCVAPDEAEAAVEALDGPASEPTP